MIKTYVELTMEERIQTFNNYQALCKEDINLIPCENFEEYDDEQIDLDFDFDAETLECLG